MISELLSADQRMRNRLTRALPEGMEISHFSVLNNLAWHDGEKTPAQLAETLALRLRVGVLGGPAWQLGSCLLRISFPLETTPACDF